MIAFHLHILYFQLVSRKNSVLSVTYNPQSSNIKDPELVAYINNMIKYTVAFDIVRTVYHLVIYIYAVQQDTQSF